MRGGETMTDTEKQTARDVVDSLQQIPPDVMDYVRGYLQGCLDRIRKEGKENADNNQARRTD
jgi:hypothetical protein